MRICRDPLVQVLAHPYWFSKKQFDERKWLWFDSMKVIPEKYVRDLGQISKETNTAIETNACIMKSPDFSKNYLCEKFYEYELHIDSCRFLKRGEIFRLTLHLSGLRL